MLSADGLTPLLPAGVQTSPEDEDVLVPLTPGASTQYVPLESTFLLTSQPDSNYTIYLDFDGHITANTEWNGAGSPLEGGRFGLPFATPAYDIDGDDTTFSEQELLNIQEAYLRVAEDFAPFDVNVTTTQPPLDDLMNAGAGDTRWGIRMVIGGSTYDWYTRTANPGAGGPAGGVALLTSFSSATDTPAYAFEESGYESGKNLAEVISHEIGHTLGLSHDGNFIEPINIPIPDPEEPPTEPEVNEYYQGHQNNLWGTIMGASYDPLITQWSMGEYYLANNVEDDLMLITDPMNGTSYRIDDHSDIIGDDELTLPSTFDLDYENDLHTASGLIGQNTDIDFFQFSVEGGDVQIDALPAQLIPYLEPTEPVDPDDPPVDIPAAVSIANLDIKIELYDSEGNWLADAAPDYDQTASLFYEDAPAGDYYVSVTGDGFAKDPQDYDLQLLGYTDYGSLGRYTLTIEGELGTPPDEFEANDTSETAYVLPPGDFFSAALSIHRIGDEDYFAYQPASDGTLTVDLQFLHASSDLDLEIRNELGQLLAISAGITDGETATLPVTADATYYIHVYAFEGLSLDQYSLSIDGPGLLPDEFEPEEPIIIAEGGFTSDLNLHFAGDEDVFEWQAPVTGEMTAEIFFDVDNVDFLLEVVDSEGGVTGSTAFAGGQQLTRPVTAGEIYTFRVFTLDSSPADRRYGEYRFEIDSALITGDRLEPNGPDNPTLIAADVGQFYKLSIDEPTDRDFFEFTAPSRGTLTVNAVFAHQFGDLDVRIEDSEGEFIALASTITDNESIVVSVEAGKTYLIQAYGYENAIVPLYALLTQFTAAPEIAGDFDSNGLINQLDLSTWAENYGRTGSDLLADANGDGVVDAIDYTVWRDSFELQALGSDSSQSQVAASLVSSPVESIRLVQTPQLHATPSVREAFTTPASDSGFAAARTKPLSLGQVAGSVSLFGARDTLEGGGPSSATQLRVDSHAESTSHGGGRELALLLPSTNYVFNEVDEDEARTQPDDSRDEAFAEFPSTFDRIG